MAKQEKRAKLFGKIGLICSILAAAGALCGLYVMVKKWNPAVSALDLGPKSTPILLANLFLSFVLGVAGFLGGLEGAVSEDKKVRSFGWVAFWFGVISTMGAIVMGICYKAYSL